METTRCFLLFSWTHWFIYRYIVGGRLCVPQRVFLFSSVALMTFCSVKQVSAEDYIAAEPISDAMSVEDVIIAFGRRAQKADTFVFEWEESNDLPEAAPAQDLGDLEDKSPELAARMRDEAREKIVEQQEGRYRLVVDGVKMRLEQSTAEPGISDLTTLHPFESASAYNGTTTTSLLQEGVAPYPRGGIARDNQTRGHEFIGTQAVITNLRGQEWVKMKGAQETSLEWTSIDGRRIAVVRLDVSERLAYELWCDATRDYAVVRLEEFNPMSRARYRQDIRLQLDASTNMWIPGGWKTLFWSSEGNLLSQESSDVTSYEIGSDIPANEFQIAFPVGTYVSNAVDGVEYILLKNGKRRIITPAERKAGLTYDELLASGPEGRQTVGRLAVLLLAGVIAVSALVCLYRFSGRKAQ